MTKMRRRYSVEEYVKALLEGDRIMLSRAITVIESQSKEDEILADQIVKTILPHSGNSIRIGLTGAPGVGKSTFIESFGKEIVKSNKKLAVLTIDPSSSRTKGSILGDKTRMSELSKEERAYIRPSPAGETLGGVTSRTREVMLLCEAAGFDVIIIETVGVGQSETLVKGMVDFFLLLMLAGSGDELQGIKRGIMELADMIVITKADGDNLERAKKTKQEFQMALSVLKSKADEVPKVLTCSSITKYNLSEVWKSIIASVDGFKNDGSFDDNRSRQAIEWMHQQIKMELIHSFYSNPEMKEKVIKYEEDILTGKAESSVAARDLLFQFWKLFQKRG
jgi:LAO/AO transport system kinase